MSLSSARRAEIGLGAWLLQRLTGVLLLVFLLGHLWVEHLLARGFFSFDSVERRAALGAYRFFDSGLLLLALVHGMAGLRRVVLDAWPLGRAADRVLSWALAAVGVVGFVLGERILGAFVAAAR